MDPNADKQKRGTELGLKKGETFIDADESTKQRVRQNNTILNKKKLNWENRTVNAHHN